MTDSSASDGDTHSLPGVPRIVAAVVAGTLALTLLVAVLIVGPAGGATPAKLAGHVPVDRPGSVGAPGTESVTTSPTSAVPSDPPVATLLAAGDIADCSDGAAATGELLQRLDGVVAALGDLAYPDGSAGRFADCYDPTWGPVADRTRPAIGNHDARTDDAAAYHEYFGAAAGPDPEGYYSYTLGAWHVIVLNSNCDMVSCAEDGAQMDWLREDLAAATTGNILAYWHHPRFSTGRHGDDPQVGPFWRVLAQAGADIVLNGHDHDYQRFEPLDADGRPDPDGIREFVVGTGGKGLRSFAGQRDTVAFRQNDQLGILQLDLQACGYAYQFLPVDGGPALDAGQDSGTCG